MALTLDGDNGISGINGSAATPAVQGTDTNTGLTFGTDTVGVVTGGTTRTTVDSSGRLLVGTTTASTSGVSKLFQVVDSAGASIGLGRTSGSPISNGEVLGGIDFLGAGLAPSAYIRCVANGEQSSTTDLPSDLTFATTPNGSGTNQERMRIDRDGQVLLGDTSAHNHGLPALQVGGSAGNGLISVRRNTTSFANQIQFWNPNGAVGTISTEGSATSYNTSSDYRLKENVVLLTGAADRLNQLQVHRFNFIAEPDRTVDGFLAHEAQAVVPEAVTGTQDEVDDEGNPVYQGIDQSKLVPLLTAALQEALAKIETLETRLTALEGGAA